MSAFLRAFAAALLAAFAFPAVAHQVKLGDLTLTDLWTRATPPGARTGAGYLTIANHGAAGDRLVAVATGLAERGELHEMKVEGGRMTMRPLDAGIPIAPGETVTLGPGGLHMMFVGLHDGFVDGGEVAVTLTFEKAGSVETFLHVLPIGAAGPGQDAGADPAKPHDHEAHDEERR